MASACRRSALVLKALRPFRLRSSVSENSRILPVYFNVRHNSQHRVIILPEVPKDTPDTNPMLYTYNQSGSDLANLPKLSEVSEKDCFYALGKALLDFEAESENFEARCKEGIMDFDQLIGPLEKAKCAFEGVWSTVNLLILVTEKLDVDRFSKLHSRSIRSLASRLDSKFIHSHLKAMLDKHLDQPFLTEEQERFLQRFMVEFKHQGFNLSENKFRELHENWLRQLRKTTMEYNLRMRTNNERYQNTIMNPDIVKDFPLDLLKAMALDSSQPSKGPWTVTLHPYIYKQFMAHCPDRRLRFNAYYAYVTRGSKRSDNETHVLSHVQKIRQFRLDQAVCLGYKSFMEKSMDTKMAGNLDTVQALINNLSGKAKERQEVELENLQNYAESRAFEEDIEVYDVEYFKRKQRQTILGMSDEDMRDYFPLPKVLSGISKLCSEMFEVEFVKVENDTSAWDPNVELWAVRDIPSQQILGHFYLDPFIRDEKGYDGGDKGWYAPLQQRSKISGTTPLGTVVFTLNPPNVGKPSLLSFAEVKEVLRIFGEMLQHTLSLNEYSDNCGNKGLELDVMDFVGEFMSLWIHQPEVINAMSGHWSSGRPLSDEVVQHLCTTIKHHMTGYELCQELYMADFDFAFNSNDDDHYEDVEEKLRKQYLLLPRIPDDSAPLYFSQMIGGEMGGCQYGKIWSQMLAADAFSAVEEVATDSSIWTNDEVKAVGKKFRSTFLASGSSIASTKLFRAFRGRDPSHKALLVSLGLKKVHQPHFKGALPE